MKIDKTKHFSRWVEKERLSDNDLLLALTEVEAGNVEVSLGSCLYKKRIVREGQGKRGSYRTIIAFRHGDRAFFPVWFR